MVKNQIVNLIHGLSFGHKFQFKTPNIAKCESTFDIYTSRPLQQCIEDLIYYLHFCPKYSKHFETLTFKMIFTLKCLGLTSIPHLCKCA